MSAARARNAGEARMSGMRKDFVISIWLLAVGIFLIIAFAVYREERIDRIMRVHPHGRPASELGVRFGDARNPFVEFCELDF